jgi:hypothetical protein
MTRPRGKAPDRPFGRVARERRVNLGNETRNDRPKRFVKPVGD